MKQVYGAKMQTQKKDSKQKKYTEAELQEKLRQIRDIYTRMTNCDYYGEDSEIKGVIIPFDLLHELDFALNEKIDD